MYAVPANKESRPLSMLSGRTMRAGLPFAAALTLAALVAGSPARSETVACASADIPAEFAICNSESLQDLDLKLDTLYTQQLASAATTPQRQQMSREHASWVRDRDACKIDLACIALRYQERILDLDGGDTSGTSNLLGFTGR